MKAMEVIGTCAWRKGAEEMLDFGSYAIPQRMSCSSGEKIPVSSAPVDSLSNSNSEISMRTLRASSTAC